MEEFNEEPTPASQPCCRILVHFMLARHGYFSAVIAPFSCSGFIGGRRNHGADMFPVHPELPAKIVEWYTTTLIKTPGNAPRDTNTPAIPQEIHTLDLIDQPGGAAKVAQTLDEARRSDPKATLFSEAVVNFVGYEHLQSGDTKGAVEILKLNAVA